MSESHSGGSSGNPYASGGGSSSGHGGSGGGPPQPFGPPVPGNRGPGFIALNAVCLALVTIVVALRMGRCLKNRTFRIDDYLIVLSWALVVVLTALNSVGVHFGAGKHMSNIPLDNLKYATTFPRIGASFIFIATAFAKLSVGLTLLHIKISRTHMIIIISTIVLAILGNIQLAVLIHLACRGGPPKGESGGDGPPSGGDGPPSGSQHGGPTEHQTSPTCIASGGVAAASYLQASVNIVTDIFFVLTPMIGLRKIRLSHKDKLATNILLGFMFTATIVSVAKLANEPEFIRNARDITWANIPISMYGIGEITLCIIAACLPAIRQLMGAYFPNLHLFSITGKTQKSTYAKGTHMSGTGPKGSQSGHGISVVRTINMDEEALNAANETDGEKHGARTGVRADGDGSDYSNEPKV